MVSRNTYHERLIKREHHDELDAQELCERSASRELLFRQAVKNQQAVQRDPICICFKVNTCERDEQKAGRLRVGWYARYANAIHDLDVRVREVEVEPAVLAEDVVFLADDGDDRNDW